MVYIQRELSRANDGNKRAMFDYFSDSSDAGDSNQVPPADTESRSHGRVEPATAWLVEKLRRRWIFWLLKSVQNRDVNHTWAVCNWPSIHNWTVSWGSGEQPQSPAIATLDQPCFFWGGRLQVQWTILEVLVFVGNRMLVSFTVVWVSDTVQFIGGLRLRDECYARCLGPRLVGREFFAILSFRCYGSVCSFFLCKNTGHVVVRSINVCCR